MQTNGGLKYPKERKSINTFYTKKRSCRKAFIFNGLNCKIFEDLSWVEKKILTDELTESVLPQSVVANLFQEIGIADFKDPGNLGFVAAGKLERPTNFPALDTRKGFPQRQNRFSIVGRLGHLPENIHRQILGPQD